MRRNGSGVTHRKIEKTWVKRGVKIHEPKDKAGQPRDNSGLCGGPSPQFRNHVWSCHFLATQTSGGSIVRILTIIDEYTHECVRSLVDRHISFQSISDELFSLFLHRGIPRCICLGEDNEIMAKALCAWLSELEIDIAIPAPGKNCRNGYGGVFEEKCKEALVHAKKFSTFQEARIWVDNWTDEFNRLINLLR
ncbi:MAG TPA: hypothetical protein VF790_05770 [Dissulfurispiraceae bacterium]